MIKLLPDMPVTGIAKQTKFLSWSAVFLFLMLFSAGCTSGGKLCPGIDNKSCGEIIAMYEIFPGELMKSDAFLFLEVRDGEKGIWIGDHTFRVIIEQTHKGYKKVPEKNLYISCVKLTGAAIKQTENTVFHIFRGIHMPELYSRQGMINYELSLMAFEKEVKAILKTGTVLKVKNPPDSCRTVFQVKTKCLKSLIYAGNIPCE